MNHPARSWQLAVGGLIQREPWVGGHLLTGRGVPGSGTNT